MNEEVYSLSTGRPETTRKEALDAFASTNALPISCVEPVDISNAVLYLASDEARYVTGHAQVADAGNLHPNRRPH